MYITDDSRVVIRYYLWHLLLLICIGTTVLTSSFKKFFFSKMKKMCEKFTYVKHLKNYDHVTLLHSERLKMCQNRNSVLRYRFCLNWDFFFSEEKINCF